jgi:hypothetical protein
VGQDAVIREAVPQGGPDGLFRVVSLAELRFFRNAPHCRPHIDKPAPRLCADATLAGLD